MKGVHLRGSHNTSGLVFPFSTLGCTAARPVRNKGAYFKVDWNCHVIAAGGKAVRRKMGRRVDTWKEQQQLFQSSSVSTIKSNSICLLRMTRGHCSHARPGGVMNVSAGELWRIEVKKVNLSLVAGALSLHVYLVTSLWPLIQFCLDWDTRWVFPVVVDHFQCLCIKEKIFFVLNL